MSLVLSLFLTKGKRKKKSTDNFLFTNGWCENKLYVVLAINLLLVRGAKLIVPKIIIIMIIIISILTACTIRILSTR